jgi:hypothetical protein
MSSQHLEKYGHLPEFQKFRQSHGLLGPKRRYTEKATEEEEEQAQVSAGDQGNATAIPASSQ